MNRTQQTLLTFRNSGRGTRDITTDISRVVAESKIATGICTVFIQHTSASLMLCENADPDVRTDVETFLSRLAPDGSREFIHDCEGPDDMPAHLRTLLLGSFLTVPVTDGKLALGTWQGIYLYEHRHHSHQRRIVVTLIGN